MDPLMHWLIPVVALLLLGFSRRKVLLLSFFAWIPDLDYLIPFHRAFFHNLFFPLIIGLLLYKFVKDKDISKIAVVFIFGHLLLDLTALAWLYPFVPYFLNMDFSVTITRWLFTPHLNLALWASPVDAVLQQQVYDSTLISFEAVMIALVLLFAFIFTKPKVFKKYLKNPKLIFKD